MCDNEGTFIWFSGPFYGNRHDKVIFSHTPPPIPDGEMLLGDAAYVGRDLLTKVVTPVKQLAGTQLNDDQKAYNHVISWWRSSIEHTFGFLKRFSIIGSTYR